MTEPAKTPKYPVGTRLVHKASGRVVIVTMAQILADHSACYIVEADVGQEFGPAAERSIDQRYDVAPKGVAP